MAQRYTKSFFTIFSEALERGRQGIYPGGEFRESVLSRPAGNGRNASRREIRGMEGDAYSSQHRTRLVADYTYKIARDQLRLSASSQQQHPKHA